LNTLTVIYNEDAADKTLFLKPIFIADRLKLITQELDGTGRAKFQKINQLTDIESEAKLL
jgi:hypothetical protein